MKCFRFIALLLAALLAGCSKSASKAPDYAIGAVLGWCAFDNTPSPNDAIVVSNQVAGLCHAQDARILNGDRKVIGRLGPFVECEDITIGGVGGENAYKYCKAQLYVELLP